MANALQQAGAMAEPSNFAPLHTNRIFTGLWTNRSPLRDAATTDYQEQNGLGRQDSILGGANIEISTRLTLRRRPGTSVYNSQVFPPIKRFYSFNTFTLTDESIRVMADTAGTVYDATGPNTKNAIWQKSPGAGSTYFLGLGSILYFTNGVDNKQWDYSNGQIYDWGIAAPTTAPTISQSPRVSPYPSWQPNTLYESHNPARSGAIIIDDTGGTAPLGTFATIPLSAGNLAISVGSNMPSGGAISFPSGYSSNSMGAWTSPAVGSSSSDIDGVYMSNANGGYVTSSFQSRSGALGASSTTNWIAIMWDNVSSVAVTPSGTLTTYVMKTANGDDLAFVIGKAQNGTTIPVPTGFNSTQMAAFCGMGNTDNVDHGLLAVQTCGLNALTVQATYNDNSSNVWNGKASLFIVFWKPGQGTATTAVTNGTALLIPTPNSGQVALIFAPNVASGGSFGIPSGYAASTLYATCAMGAAQITGGDNKAHGWSVTLSGQTVTANYTDTSGHSWPGNANCFAVASIAATTTGNVEFFNGNGTTGAAEPTWNTNVGGITQDGSVRWTNLGTWRWRPAVYYAAGSVVMGIVRSPSGTPNQIFIATTPGSSGPTEPGWVAGIGIQIGDGGGGLVWTCQGRALGWSDIGASTNVTAASTILDSSGYLESIGSPGKSGASAPTWPTELGATTSDNTVIWVNAGNYNAGATDSAQWGYAYKNSVTGDISNMSPPSVAVTLGQGAEVTVQGDGSGDPQVDTIVIYRTPQGGSTFLWDAEIPNPGGGQKWSYVDNNPDSALNTEIQAQVNGEGTPLPAGATCLAYHNGRIAAAVGNVVYLSSGPDAIVSTSSGNAGFDTTFTAQSKITRFWTCSLGLVVFTVRDSYIVLGSGTASDPMYMVLFIEDIPLRSYDCFTVNKTTPYLMMGNNVVVALDPSAGVTETSFPIADRIEEEFDSSSSYVTFLNQSSKDTALFVANGNGYWYRLAATSAPETGSNWSPRANINGMGCVQSVEVAPGQYRLLMSSTTGGTINQRDATVNTDLGIPFPSTVLFGSIVLAHPGQLAAVSFITLESARVGTRPGLALLMGEISGTFETLFRTRQDPPNLPPSRSLYSDRYHFEQNQKPAWCRHFQMQLTWPAEDAANELLTFTIFGETWNESRSQ